MRVPMPMSRHHRRRGRAAVAVSALAVLMTTASAATAPTADAATVGVPAGASVAAREELAPGVKHVTFQGNDLSAHVAVIEPDAPVALRTVLAEDRIGGALERPSAMCARVGCLLAVNGDYTLPDTTVPVGGVVRDGVLLRSPSPTHHQLVIGRDGGLAAGTIAMRGRVASTDLRSFAIDGVNRPREADEVVLYTPASGARTATNRHGVELVATPVDGAAPARLGETVVAKVERLADGGNARIPPEGFVLSGHGAGATHLARLWKAIESGDVGRRILVRLESEPDAFQSVGGTPLLLRHGQPWHGEGATSFVNGDHPRTVVGWDGDGRVFIVTVDGRQPGHSAGMSIAEVAQFVRQLGATDALNLDGGGSTVFVVGGTVVNRPSDRLVDRAGEQRIVPVPRPDDVVLGNVERPRTTALAVVPVGDVDVDPADPLADDALQLPAGDRRCPAT